LSPAIKPTDTTADAKQASVISLRNAVFDTFMRGPLLSLNSAEIGSGCDVDDLVQLDIVGATANPHLYCARFDDETQSEPVQTFDMTGSRDPEAGYAGICAEGSDLLLHRHMSEEIRNTFAGR
jgi:hypothetical protein